MLKSWNSREGRVWQRVPQLIKELVCELSAVLGVARHVGDELQFITVSVTRSRIFICTCNWLQSEPIAWSNFIPYLNNTLHDVGLVVNELAGGLLFDQVFHGVQVAESKRLDVIEQS